MILAVVALAAYANSLGGKFVYDDRIQILENHLLRDPDRLGEALTSDVWAFKGAREEAWSNYWRPVFVAWLAANHALFGVASSAGWHLANMALHAGVVVAAFFLLCRLGFATPPAAAIGAVFAVHPVHVESVAWISGSPDLLTAFFQLLALLLILPGEELILPGEQRPSRGRWLAALACYLLALGAKEIAVVFPVLVATAVAGHLLDHGGADRGGADRGEPRQRAWWRAAWRRGIITSLPFVALAVLFFAARAWVLGMVEVQTPWRMGPAGLLLTAPSLLAFYLRQALLPAWLGPSYPLRAVTTANAGFENLALPLLAVAGAAVLAVWLVRRRPRLWLGPALFLVPLLPAFNVNAFIPEQLVHDRYLYLPLLGFWMTVLGAAWLAAGDLAPARRRRAERALLFGTGLLLLPLAAQTVRYNRAWGSELALWERGLVSDPTSAFNRAQLGHALLEAGRPDEALATLNDALAIRPVTSALLDRARILRGRGDLEGAERDLRLVQADQPDNPHPYEQLAAVLERRGRRAEAISELRRGRDAVPYQRCAMTSNLGVLLYLDGRKTEALAELESVQPLVGVEAGSCTLAAFHLGTLYKELGRPAESRQALERYLEATEDSAAGESNHRTLAQRMLREMP